MTYQDYMAVANKTWKKDDGLKELEHCLVAILEESGEIAGWYKKALFYGVPKETIKPKLKGEFGDLLYYLCKLAEKTQLIEIAESRLEDTWVMPSLGEFNTLAALADLGQGAVDMLKLSHRNADFVEAYVTVLDTLTYMIREEGWDVTDIQYSNLAKLKKRHGEAFNQDQANPENRDIAAEDDVV